MHSLVGMCPQDDIVWSEMTVQEHLAFQARQRGVPEIMLNAEVRPRLYPSYRG